MCLGDPYYMRGSFKDMLTFRCNTIRNACPCQSVMLTDLIVRNHIINSVSNYRIFLSAISSTMIFSLGVNNYREATCHIQCIRSYWKIFLWRPAILTTQYSIKAITPTIGTIFLEYVNSIQLWSILPSRLPQLFHKIVLPTYSAL